MAVPKHLDEAVVRLRAASSRIAAARTRPVSEENLRDWLDGLTDFAAALSDVQRFNNESVHEKLHDLADRVGVKTFPAQRARPQPD